MNQKSKNIQKYLYPVLYGAFGMLGLLLGITCWIMDRDAYPHLYPFFMMVALFCLAACGIAGAAVHSYLTCAVLLYMGDSLRICGMVCLWKPITKSRK